MRKKDKNTICKISEIKIETNLNVEDVYGIVCDYILTNNLPYTICKKTSILFDEYFDLLAEPAWLVAIEYKNFLPGFDPQIEFIVVCDSTGELKYKINPHGVTFNI